MPNQRWWRRGVCVKLGGMVVALLALFVLYHWAHVRMLSATEGDAAAANHAGRARVQALSTNASGQPGRLRARRRRARKASRPRARRDYPPGGQP